jgi:uncharacterized RDD family membrane protein YckC
MGQISAVVFTPSYTSALHRKSGQKLHCRIDLDIAADHCLMGRFDSLHATSEILTSREKSMKFAGSITRLVAYLIDGLSLGILAGLVSFFLGGLVGLTAGTGSGFLNFISGTLGLLLLVVVTLFQFIYFGWFWSRDGQSIGMKLLNIKVVRRQSEGPLSFVRAGLRGSVGYWISSLIFGLGFIWILFDGHKEGWHDKIFDTWVIRT